MRILVNGAGGHMGGILCGLLENGERTERLAGAVGHAGGERALLPSLESFSGEADCLIDFSHHAATEELTAYAVRRRMPLVIAATGQTEEERALIRAASRQIPVFFSANLSLGIAVLVQLTKTAVKMFPDADIEIVEQHHNRKLDVPSGTALLLADAVRAVRTDAFPLVGRHENGKRAKNEIGIHSLRMGNTVGVHEVIINTGAQTLTLRHEAQDRALFAEGALAAAAFLTRQGLGLYTMEDLVREA